MRAITITTEKEPVQLVEMDKPSVSGDECLVRIHAAALNRRDQWMREGKYPGIQPGTVLGSDGCGVVEEGPQDWVGKEVIINPNIDWGDNPDVQSAAYTILGMPKHGTLADYVKVPAHRLHLKPSHLTAEQAAAIPLAGLTAFRATMVKGQAAPGKRVLITGAGGGVSQFALQFAVSAGAEVFASSRSEEKIARSIEMGAKAGFLVSQDDWWKEAVKSGPFDAIIDSTGGNALNTFLRIVRPGGRIVMYGSTTGYPEKFDVFRLFWTQAQVMGSTMGNDSEFAEMVAFINRHGLVPSVDQVFSPENHLAAFDRFRSPDHSGKIVVKFS